MNDRRERFVEAKVAGASNTEAAKVAGFSPDSAHNQGFRLMRDDDIRSAIEHRGSAAMREAGLSPVDAYRALKKALEDDDRHVRPSQVRAAEVTLRASGEIGPDSQVIVDARTALFASGEAPSLADLEALASQLADSSDELSPAGDTQ